jgi:uncharacterized protein YdbL (DUF1318 family)
MKSHLFIRLLFGFAVMAFGTVASRAEDLNAVKARIEQRLGSIDAAKARGAIGENNRGFLEARGNASAADQKIIADENADRHTVYASIAAQYKTAPDAVGRQRAQQIASIARPGTWIQDAGGAWRQK